MRDWSLLLVLSLCVVPTLCGRVGILYEGWHAYAAAAQNQVAAKGGQQLTVDDVITSNGAKTLSDIYDKYGISPAVSANFYYQSKPAAGFYCLYAKRANETGWGVPDCANITGTATRHAKQLNAAGIDFVVVDGTNIPTMSAQGDVLQLRPLELLFQEWAALRKAGMTTPQIAAWGCLPSGATLWKNYLDLYNNPAYAGLAMVDSYTNKKVFFATNNPDASLVAQIESNGGRNDVVVQVMWALVPASEMQTGKWTFFSACVASNGNFGSSVVGEVCNQIVTMKANIGPHGSQMSVSPSYQMNYGSLPFVAPGKLAGYTFRKQFRNAFAAQPDYLFISSWNEYISQPQANPYPNVNIAFDMGLPNDPGARSLFVDSYGWEFSRDIEPNEKYGSDIYNLMASCVALYKTGARSCTDANNICCQDQDGYFINVYSLQSTSKNSVSDYLISNNPAEVQPAINSGTYSEICTPFSGSNVFCTGNSVSPQIGPFIIYQAKIYPDLIALYRCAEGTSRHFISTQASCEGQKMEYLLGYISPSKGRETLRALYRCLNHATNAHYHSIDLNCAPADTDAGLLGYVR